MAEQAGQVGRERVRAVVVFRFPVYRDLITRVLTKADVHVAGALDVKVLTRHALRALRPDVVVIYDPDANNLLRQVASSALLDPDGGDVHRIVCVGSDNEMIVLKRLVVPNPSVEGLVGTVKDVECDTLRNLTVEVPVAELGELPEQRMSGSGGS